MYLINFLLFKLLKLNIFNELLSKYVSIKYHNNENKLRIDYYKKHFSVLNNNSSNNNKLCLFNNLFSAKSIETISLYIFLLNIFKFNGFKPAIFSSFKINNLINNLDILSLPPLLSYNSLFFKDVINFETINQIKKYKWKNVSCGIFALSSTFKDLKTEEFSLKNERHKKILKKNLLKSIDYANSFYRFYKKNKIGSAIFSDPGYVGQGEMFEILTNKNIPCYQFFMSIDENKIIFKKYLKDNQKDHFDKISDDNWKNLLNKKRKKKHLKN